jgi:hypothetical protein
VKQESRELTHGSDAPSGLEQTELRQAQIGYVLNNGRHQSAQHTLKIRVVNCGSETQQNACNREPASATHHSQNHAVQKETKEPTHCPNSQNGHVQQPVRNASTAEPSNLNGQNGAQEEPEVHEFHEAHEEVDDSENHEDVAGSDSEKSFHSTDGQNGASHEHAKKPERFVHFDPALGPPSRPLRTPHSAGVVLPLTNGSSEAQQQNDARESEEPTQGANCREGASHEPTAELQPAVQPDVELSLTISPSLPNLSSRPRHLPRDAGVAHHPSHAKALEGSSSSEFDNEYHDAVQELSQRAGYFDPELGLSNRPHYVPRPAGLPRALRHEEAFGRFESLKVDEYHEMVREYRSTEDLERPLRQSSSLYLPRDAGVARPLNHDEAFGRSGRPDLDDYHRIVRQSSETHLSAHSGLSRPQLLPRDAGVALPLTYDQAFGRSGALQTNEYHAVVRQQTHSRLPNFSRPIERPSDSL